MCTTFLGIMEKTCQLTLEERINIGPPAKRSPLGLLQDSTSLGELHTTR